MNEQEMNILDDTGLNLAAFEPVTAAILGAEKGEEGVRVLAAAEQHGRKQVQLRDWLYCLVKIPGTIMHAEIADRMGQDPKRFVEILESNLESDSEEKGLAPDRLTSGSVSGTVLPMLEKAWALSKEGSRERIGEPVLTLAILECADEDLILSLEAFFTKDGLRKLKQKLKPNPIIIVDPFDADGTLRMSLFDQPAKQFMERLREDGASLGASSLTIRHVLYSLLGDESGVLTMALGLRGIDVKKDMHAMLSRELARPGRKRREGLVLTRDTLLGTVKHLLVKSYSQARNRGVDRIGKIDIARAFAAEYVSEFERFFPRANPLDVAALRAYLEAADDVVEDQGDPILRYSIDEIEKLIKGKVLGQDEAINRVMPWIKRLRFGFPRDGRPAGVFLFLGPTGTGKTQLAKELARFVFGDEDMMIFLEMGQFQSKESMNMFVGAPPGYVGYGDGKLTNGLRDKPQCVVLFDEIEKAHIEVFDTLLRFADEGMISDPAGPVRDGRKCILVLTTNAGQRWLRNHLEKNPDALENPGELSELLFKGAMDEMSEKGFRPEFLGRVDERITFLPFTLETCRKIVDLVLNKELNKFRDLKNVEIVVPEEVRDFMARSAEERSMDEGARGAPRAVNQYIVTPAIDLLGGDPAAVEGGCKLIASMLGVNKVILEKPKSP